jgi:glycosyltransferase involved in cell wall biosynthesis
MVTTAAERRHAALVKSVDCFRQQTYQPKELVVVSLAEGEDRARLEKQLSSVGRHDVVTALPGRRLSLGALRNLAMESARGSVLCQWDDDDLSDPRRLEHQVGHLLATGADAVLLRRCLHVLADAEECYVVDWGKTRFRGHPGSWGGRSGHA